MSLDGLPEEVLIIILRRLDIKSLNNLYEASCHRVRNVICTPSVIKKCDFSFNNMATAQSLKLDFFRGVSRHLRELNMCGVPDLNKTLLLQAMKKMKSVLTLDVSYTHISILDLLDICEVCPTIQNICIDYKLFNKPNPQVSFPQELVTKCQDVFANFKNVKFVGSLHNLLLSELPQLILVKSQLNTLSYSMSKVDEMFTYYKYNESNPICCNKFTIHFYGNRSSISSFSSRSFCVPFRITEVLEKVSFSYEYIFISTFVYCSPLLQNFFLKSFKIYAKDSLPRHEISVDGGLFIVWNKESTNFNESFYSNLLLEIKIYFPTIVTYLEGMIAPDPINSDWICVTHLGIENERIEMEENAPALKKRRVVSPNIALNYDRFLESMHKVQLSINFFEHVRNPITLPSRCTFLKKLTFLSLSGSVRFSSDFFNILFRSCENLITLNVEAAPIARSTLSISRTIPLSRSLKNLRLVDTTIDFKTLFSSLSQCRTLQNIQIHDVSEISNDISNPDTLFKQLDDLCYLRLQAMMSESVRPKKLQMFNKSKLKFGRNYLLIELFSARSDVNYIYNPFVDVFKLHVTKFCM